MTTLQFTLDSTGACPAIRKVCSVFFDQSCGKLTERKVSLFCRLETRRSGLEGLGPRLDTRSFRVSSPVEFRVTSCNHGKWPNVLPRPRGRSLVVRGVQCVMGWYCAVVDRD